MNNYLNYKTYNSYDCYNSCIYNYCQNQNLHFTRGDIYFYGEPIIITLNAPEADDFSTNLHSGQILFHRDVFPESRMLEFKNDLEAKQYLIDSLTTNPTFLILQVSTTSLTYDKTFLEYRRMLHFVSILGIDDSHSKLYISDGNTPNFQTYQGYVDFDCIFDGWKSEKFKTFTLIPNDNIDIQSIKEQSKHNFLLTLESYLNPSSDESFYRGKDTMREYFKNLLRLSKETSLVPKINDIIFQIKWKGFLTLKYFILDYIKENSYSPEIIKGYDEIINGWELFCFKLIRAIVSNNHSKIEGCFAFGENLLTNEEQIISQILNSSK